MGLYRDNDCIGGRYRLMRELDRNRGTLLWEAHDDEEMELVHVRILEDHLRRSPLVAMRFRREAKLAIRLDHEALSTAREVVDNDHILALVYDVPGTETLASRLHQGAIEVAEILLVMGPVLDGLEYAHRRGVVHRNIGARHLWIDSDGGGRMSGFGDARVLDMVGLTTQSMAFGISHYRAPEQWLQGDSDLRTDVWALGVLLFEMVTGRAPVETGGPRAMIEAFETLDLNKELAALAAEPVGQAIAGALQMSRRSRFSSVGAMAEVLLGSKAVKTPVLSSDAVPCWRCQTPRIVGIPYCFDCGAGPLLKFPGMGTIDLVVPKLRSGAEEVRGGKRFRGTARTMDLFYRSFEPRLDAGQKALLWERLRQAGAELDATSEQQMAHSPFRIARKLTDADARRLRGFLMTGKIPEPPESDEISLENPAAIITDEIPVLYHNAMATTNNLRIKNVWSMRGVGWSSPFLFTVFGLVAIPVSLIFVWLSVVGFFEMGMPAFAVLFFGLLIVAPLWVSLGLASLRGRKPVTNFSQPRQSLFHEKRCATWRQLIEDLGSERDRRLVEELLTAIAEASRRERIDINLNELLQSIETDVAILGRAPGDKEWQHMQVAWESVEARNQYEPHSDEVAGRERGELAEQMKRHEMAGEDAELARARLFHVLQAIQDREEQNTPESRQPDVPENLDSSGTGDGLRDELQELRLLHEAFRDVEGAPDLSIPTAARQEVSLQLDLPERFDVIRKIDDGGMASIYLARDDYREEQVALKIVHPHLRDHAGVRSMMAQEFAAARRTRHPGLITIHEHLEVDDVDVLVMEYAPGVDLKSMIRWRGRLPVAEVREIARKTLEALGSAHRSGVIHGDIKPANIIIGEAGDGNGGALKIVDFGLARMEYLASDEELEARLGTPGYVAPEILEGGLVDERADIYGVGLTMMEALTGELPFGSGDTGYIAGDDFDEVGAGVELTEVLKRSVDATANKRFRSADEMAAALGPMADKRSPSPVATVDDHCHRCSGARIANISRCFECGARRHDIARSTWWHGHQVVLLPFDDGEKKRKAFSHDELESVRQIIEDFGQIRAAEQFDETLSELPAILTPPIHNDDAEVLQAALRDREIPARVSPSRWNSWFRTSLSTIPRIAASSKPLLALLPCSMVVLLIMAFSYALRSSAMTSLAALIVLGFGLVTVAAIGLLFFAELRPALRSATDLFEKIGQVNKIAVAPWESRAFDIYQRATTQRSRSLIFELVQSVADLRQQWSKSSTRSHLVERIDGVMERALNLADELVESEEYAIDDDYGAHAIVVSRGSRLLTLRREMASLRADDLYDDDLYGDNVALEIFEKMGTVLDFDESGNVDDFSVVQEAEEAASR